MSESSGVTEVLDGLEDVAVGSQADHLIAPRPLTKMRALTQAIAAAQTQLDRATAERQAYVNGYLEGMGVDFDAYDVPVDLDAGTYLILPRQQSADAEPAG